MLKLLHTTRFWLALTLAYFSGSAWADDNLSTPPISSSQISLDLTQTTLTRFEFRQQLNQTTRLTLPTYGYTIALRGPVNNLADETIAAANLSTDDTLILQTSLLIPGQQCQTCTIVVESQLPLPSDIPLAVTLDVFDNEKHADRLALEHRYFDTFEDGWTGWDELVTPQLIEDLLGSVINTDQIRGCELAVSYTVDIEAVTKCITVLNEKNKLYFQFQNSLALGLWSTDRVQEANQLLLKNLTTLKGNQTLYPSEKVFLVGGALRLLASLENKRGHYEIADKYGSSSVRNYLMLGRNNLAGSTLHDLGVSRRFRHELDQAGQLLNQAHELVNKSIRPEPAQFMRIEYNTAVVHALKGQYFYASRLLVSSERLARKDDMKIWLAHIVAAKARVALDLGQLDEAEKLYFEAWHEYENQGALSHLGTLANNMARLYTERGDFERARHYLEQANHYTGNHWGEDQQIRIQQAQINYHLKNGNVSAALSELNSMQEALLNSTDYFRLGRFYNQKAETLLLAQQPTLALEALDTAIAHSQQANDNLNLTRNFYLQALAYNQLSAPLDQIRTSLEQATNVIENIRSHLLDDRLRRDYFALQKNIYQLGIQAQLRTEPDNSFNSLFIAESFRARTLYENLTRQSNQSHTPGEAENLLDQSFALITKPASKNKKTNATEDLARLTRSELQQYQQQLPEDTGVLLFFVGEQESYAWLVQRHTTHLAKLADTNALTSSVNALTHHINSRPQGGNRNRWADFIRANQTLSEHLLSPLAEKIAGLRYLTVIPDGALHRVPFGLLLNPNKQYRQPIQTTLTLRYASSIATDHWLNSHPASVNSRGLLMVAAPAIIESSDVALVELPSAAIEADRLMALWPGENNQLLRAEQASKKALLEARPGNFKIVHFATHAVVDWDNPSQSAIKLAGNWQKPSLESPDLTLAEIAQLDLNADLVVLSACETAAGKLSTGEGPIGLSRAFFEAGAKRVVASLWPVDDVATSELLTVFYQALAEGDAPELALRQAQLTMQTTPEFAHPYFWAGFIIMGARSLPATTPLANLDAKIN